MTLCRIFPIVEGLDKYILTAEMGIFVKLHAYFP